MRTTRWVMVAEATKLGVDVTDTPTGEIVPLPGVRKPTAEDER